MAEALLNTQLPSGYDEEFVNEVEDDFLCLICQLPLREPVQTICGHRFCKACLEEHLRRQEVQNQPCTCPADREGLNRDQPDVFPDKATARKILSMVIKCPSDGCSWTGELRNKEAHLEACTFKMVACTNEHCLEQVKRKDLEQHVTITCAWRIIECEYCEEPHPRRHLQVHLENCSKIPLSCPNSCGKLIPREMVPNHIDNDCPLSLVPCPHAQMGCTEKFQRKDVDPHLQSHTREHLDLACVKLNSTQVQLNETRVQLDETRVQLDETRVQLDEQRVQLNETRAKLSRLTQDQLTIIKESQETKIKFEENLEALQKQINTMIVKLNGDSGNTLFTWKITSFLSEFMKQKQGEEQKTIESDPFYTAFCGYKLKVFVDLNYRYSRLMVGIRLMEGEYDDLLPWPFSLTITFTAFGQEKMDKLKTKPIAHVRQLSPTKENLSLPLFSRRPRGGSTADGRVEDFLRAYNLHEGRYILNDTLSLQVDVLRRPDTNLSCSTPGSRGLPA